MISLLQLAELQVMATALCDSCYGVGHCKKLALNLVKKAYRRHLFVHWYGVQEPATSFRAAVEEANTWLGFVFAFFFFFFAAATTAAIFR